VRQGAPRRVKAEDGGEGARGEGVGAVAGGRGEGGSQELKAGPVGKEGAGGAERGLLETRGEGESGREGIYGGARGPGEEKEVGSCWGPQAAA